MHSAFRNYAGPQHCCHYRGYDSAWVPGTVLGARIGRTILLFRIELGLNGLPCLLCTTRPLTRQGPILRKLRRRSVLRALKGETAQQRVGDRAGGQRRNAHRGGRRDRSSRRRRNTVPQGYRPGERQYRPTTLDGFFAQAAVGVDHTGVADGLEHRHIGDRVGVGVAIFQRVALTGGQLVDGLYLALAVAVERHVAGVLAVLDDHSGRHRMGSAQRSRDRRHDLLS